MCSKTIFDSTTNHLNLELICLNCLLLDLAVLDLISSVCVEKFGLKLQINVEMQTSWEEGGLKRASV